MLELNEALSGILSGTQDILKQNGFEAVKPEGNPELPVFTDGDHSYMDFSGEKGKIRMELFGNQALLFVAQGNPDEIEEDNLTKASVNYFNLDEFDQRDIKSLCNEFNDTISDKFGFSSATGAKAKKMPTPVSKSAAKSGSQAYDGNTLANRLSAIYPELKAPYKENFEKYGEFLPEEFFENYGAQPVINTIKNGSDQEVKRLFKILNDIYENGSTDTQGLIGVTILGKMNNDEQLCKRAEEYMCDDMREIVMLINKFLASSKGAKAKEKMKNPPPYKPKKEKKPGMLSQMMAAGGAQNGGIPPM
ncbi:MAG TPA: hypothetical protein DCR23_05580 [Ruminococcaceae bacterium]|nr:hypothetical protein [Oscillospiraceae bacterium]